MKNTGKEMNFIVWNKRLSVMFLLEDQIHLDSEWLFTVVFEIWELKLWQMQNNILSAGSQRQAHFLFTLVFFL